MKIVWLAPYPITGLEPDLQLLRKRQEHNAPWIVNLSNELAKIHENRLFIITHSPLIVEDQCIEKNGIFFYILKSSFPFTSKGYPSYFPLDRLTYFGHIKRKYKEIINKIDPDIIHAHGTENVFALVAGESSIHSVVSIQGIMDKIYKTQKSFPAFLQIPIEKKSIKLNKYFCCRTEFDTAYVQKLNPDSVIFNAPEAISNIFFNKQWSPSKNMVIIFVGSVLKRKGVEILLDSLKIVIKTYPTIKLRLIGPVDNIYKTFLIAKIERMRLSDNVEFLGQQNPDIISNELSRCSVFVLPTLMDNSPNSLAEAMAIGVPSIASRVGGIPSMINNYQDGILFTQGDIQELATNIIEVLNNKSLQKKLSHNASVKGRQRNFPSIVAEKTLEIYREIINYES